MSRPLVRRSLLVRLPALAALAAAVGAGCAHAAGPAGPGAPPPEAAPAPEAGTTRLARLVHPPAPPGRRLAGPAGGGGPLPRTWRGLRLEARSRCPDYDASAYGPPGPPPRLRARGGWRELAGCALFAGPGAEAAPAARLVPAAVAHDAGLCRAPPGVRAAFAADPDNVLHLPRSVAALRRYLADTGAPVWTPARNRCWYVRAQLRVRRRYDLSVTPAEAAAFDAVLAGCAGAPAAPACGPPGAF